MSPRSTSRPAAAVEPAAEHRACRPHDDHADGREPVCVGDARQPRLPVVTATGEITGHLVTGVYPHDNKLSGDGRRLYNTSIGPIAVASAFSGAAPLTETPGEQFQFTVADTETLQIRDGYGARTPSAHGSSHRTRRASTRSCHRACGGRVRPCEPQSYPAPRSAGEAGRDGRGL